MVTERPDPKPPTRLQSLAAGGALLLVAVLPGTWREQIHRAIWAATRKHLQQEDS